MIKGELKMESIEINKIEEEKKVLEKQLNLITKEKVEKINIKKSKFLKRKMIDFKNNKNFCVFLKKVRYFSEKYGNI